MHTDLVTLGRWSQHLTVELRNFERFILRAALVSNGSLVGRGPLLVPAWGVVVKAGITVHGPCRGGHGRAGCVSRETCAVQPLFHVKHASGNGLLLWVTSSREVTFVLCRRDTPNADHGICCRIGSPNSPTSVLGPGLLRAGASIRCVSAAGTDETGPGASPGAAETERPGRAQWTDRVGPQAVTAADAGFGRDGPSQAETTAPAGSGRDCILDRGLDHGRSRVHPSHAPHIRDVSRETGQRHPRT
jgi:hypothetical protein